MQTDYAHRDMPRSLADSAYSTLKADILDFRLAPGDRFTETEVAARLEVSRTPVREALFRLEREGYLEVRQRNGWLVKPLDFNTIDHFYELRSVLEISAVHKLCQKSQPASAITVLRQLARVWLVEEKDRSSDTDWLAEQDECFHIELVAAAGNLEISRAHRAATERIRIVRRLDFTQPARIHKTYEEHAAILRAVLAQDSATAATLLQAHIEQSQAEVRTITLHRLYSTRAAILA